MGRGSNPLYGEKINPRHLKKLREASLNIYLVHALSLLRGVVNAQPEPITKEECRVFLKDLLEGKVEDDDLLDQSTRASSLISSHAKEAYEEDFEELTQIEQEQVIADLLRQLQLEKKPEKTA